jgi:hypothetical protein
VAGLGGLGGLTTASSHDEIRRALVRDRVCKACGGTGRKGRGVCRACRGFGREDLRHPRVVFNHGYHDARFDLTTSSRGPRTVVDRGPQTERIVSREYDPWYAVGYEFGLEDVRAGRYAGNSDPAWLRWTGGLPGSADDPWLRG